MKMTSQKEDWQVDDSCALLQEDWQVDDSCALLQPTCTLVLSSWVKAMLGLGGRSLPPSQAGTGCLPPSLLGMPASFLGLSPSLLRLPPSLLRLPPSLLILSSPLLRQSLGLPSCLQARHSASLMVALPVN